MVGGLIMAHGDDDGLRVPPRLAPIQTVVLAVRDEGDVVATVRRDHRRAHRCRRAARSSTRVPTCRWVGAPPTGSSRACPCGWRSGLAISPTASVTLVRRITGGEERKVAVPLDGVVAAVTAELARQQDALLAEATELRESRTVDVKYPRRRA